MHINLEMWTGAQWSYLGVKICVKEFGIYKVACKPIHLSIKDTCYKVIRKMVIIDYFWLLSLYSTDDKEMIGMIAVVSLEKDA